MASGCPMVTSVAVSLPVSHRSNRMSAGRSRVVKWGPCSMRCRMPAERRTRAIAFLIASWRRVMHWSRNTRSGRQMDRWDHHMQGTGVIGHRRARGSCPNAIATWSVRALRKRRSAFVNWVVLRATCLFFSPESWWSTGTPNTSMPEPGTY